MKNSNAVNMGPVMSYFLFFFGGSDCQVGIFFDHFFCCYILPCVFRSGANRWLLKFLRFAVEGRL